MSKALHMLRWLVWSSWVPVYPDMNLPWETTGQGEREACGGGPTKVNPAELIEVSRALADSQTSAQETNASRCMAQDFRVFLHSIFAVANTHTG